MSYYRMIYTSFWNDPKIEDEFTPEDKYFYLYLLTNPKGSLAGCIQISKKNTEAETGYSWDTILKLIKRMVEVHKVIDYDEGTKEILILNWYKHNWNRSSKMLSGVTNCIETIKSEKFANHIAYLVDCVSSGVKPEPYDYGGSVVNVPIKQKKDATKERHKYGEFKNVLLTDEDVEKLDREIPDHEKWIQKLSEYMEMTGKTYKNHYLTIRNWYSRENKPKKETKDYGNPLDLFE